MNYDFLLESLYALTQLEQERELNDSENKLYIAIVEYLQDENIAIDFAINI